MQIEVELHRVIEVVLEFKMCVLHRINMKAKHLSNLKVEAVWYLCGKQRCSFSNKVLDIKKLHCLAIGPQMTLKFV